MRSHYLPQKVQSLALTILLIGLPILSSILIVPQAAVAELFNRTPKPDPRLRQKTSEGDAFRAREAERLLEQGVQKYRGTESYSYDTEAREFWQQALDMYRDVQDLDGEAKLLMKIGNVCRSLSRCRHPSGYYEKALPIFQQLKDQKGEVQALSNLGDTSWVEFGGKEAIRYYEKALPIFQQLKDQKGETKILLQLGDFYLKGQYKPGPQPNKAINYYERALSISQKTKDPDGETTALFNLGRAYESLSQHEEAIRFYKQAIPIFPKVSSSLEEGNIEAAVMRNLGFLYNAQYRYKEAISYYEKALSIYRKYQDKQGEGSILFHMAKVYNTLSQPEKAIYYYEQALPIYEQFKARTVEIRDRTVEILFDLGDSYASLSQYKKAIGYYEELRAAYENYPGRQEAAYASILVKLSEMYEASSQSKKASNYYEQVVNALQSIPGGGDADRGRTASDIGAFFQQQNQIELAIIFYKNSVNWNESFRRDFVVSASSGQIPQTVSRDAVEIYIRHIAQTYRNLANLLLQQNRVVEALKVLDLLKVQDLQDFAAAPKRGSFMYESIELLPEERDIVAGFIGLIEERIGERLEEFVTDAQGNTFNSRGQKIPPRDVADEKVRQESMRKALKAFPEHPTIQPLIKTLQSTAANQDLKLPYYQDLQTQIKKLGSHIALFYPLILDDRLELVVLTNDRPPIHKPVAISRQQLETEIQAFRQQLQGRSPLVQQPAQQLYQRLIQPIEAELKAASVDTIVYAPDSFLRYVPLAALHDGTQWLAQRYQINYLTALALTPLDKPKTVAPKVLAGAVTKEYSPIVNGQKFLFPALGQTQTEVARIAQLYPNTQVLINNQLSRAALESNLDRSTIVHLATHASFLSNNPDQSFILLGDGSTLSLRDLNTLKFPNVSLFVLSACETALGSKLGNGIEIFGFGYQLQRNQVRASLASLWQVSDGGTQVLMNRFYDELKQGKTVAKAMQQVQQAFIERKITPLEMQQIRAASLKPNVKGGIPVDLTHPFYWAPFILIGNGL